jgi:hypothetical protein
MESYKSIRYVDHDIEDCPRCGHSHHFWLQIRPTSLENREPLFGGPGAYELAFACPETGQILTREIPNPPDGEIVGYSDSINVPQVSSSSESPPAAESEFSEWIKSSRATATDFCKTMLTTSAGAIPVYFAVLKYLGIEQIESTLLASAGIIPPVLFLAAIILFALALRPRFAVLTEAEFDIFRAERYLWLNRYILAGTILFTAGVCLAIVIFFLSLNALQ